LGLRPFLSAIKDWLPVAVIVGVKLELEFRFWIKFRVRGTVSDRVRV
jgi:hypothetical protein